MKTSDHGLLGPCPLCIPFRNTTFRDLGTWLNGDGLITIDRRHWLSDWLMNHAPYPMSTAYSFRSWSMAPTTNTISSNRFPWISVRPASRGHAVHDQRRYSPPSLCHRGTALIPNAVPPLQYIDGGDGAYGQVPRRCTVTRWAPTAHITGRGMRTGNNDVFEIWAKWPLEGGALAMSLRSVLIWTDGESAFVSMTRKCVDVHCFIHFAILSLSATL